MTRREGRPARRVQVYFENPKIEQALRREARQMKLPISRAAEQVIARGLTQPPTTTDDRLRAIEAAVGDHTRLLSQDLTVLLEIEMAFARAVLSRLPETPDETATATTDSMMDAMLKAAAARIIAGATRRALTCADDNPTSPPAEVVAGPAE